MLCERIFRMSLIYSTSVLRPAVSKWIGSLWLGFSWVSQVLADTDCSYTNVYGVKMKFECNDWDYCCADRCCRSYSPRFFNLWYFWFVIALLFLLCATGGFWWRRRLLQRRAAAAGTVVTYRVGNENNEYAAYPHVMTSGFHPHPLQPGVTVIHTSGAPGVYPYPGNTQSAQQQYYPQQYPQQPQGPVTTGAPPSYHEIYK